ncbi:MAG: hypothetical protein R6U00_09310, partial [Prochlorococcaceae cyanobacterium]
MILSLKSVSFNGIIGHFQEKRRYPMITLLDYGAGNVRSVVNAIEKSGHTVHMAASGDDIARAEKLVFPGVGNFGQMMQVLGDKGFVE